MKVIILLICILFSVAFANRNAWQRQEVGVANPKASKKWHLWEFIVKCCFAAAIALLTETWFHKGFALLMVTAIDFIVFPAVLNLRTAQKWDYLSATGIDGYLRKIPTLVLFTLKMILLIISVTFYFRNPFSE